MIHEDVGEKEKTLILLCLKGKEERRKTKKKNEREP